VGIVEELMEIWLNKVCDSNKTLSSTLEVVLRQIRVPIPQSKNYREEYRKKKLVVSFSFWSVFILTKYITVVTM